MTKSYHKKQKKRTNAKLGSAKPVLQAAALMGMLIVMFYLWGRVRIDSEMRKIENLEIEKAALRADLDNLYMKYNTVTSFNIIKSQAANLGLGPVPASRREQLYVDYDSYKSSREETKIDIYYAGMIYSGSRKILMK